MKIADALNGGCAVVDELDVKALTLDQKIDIFEHRVRLWMFEPAQKIADDVGESGWAVLHIILPYFEMIGKFRAGYCGTDESLRFFKEGFKWVFMESPLNVPVQAGRLDGVLSHVFYSVQAGLIHTSLQNPHVVLDDESIVPLKVHFLSTLKDYIEVNPKSIVEPLEAYFDSYLAQLRNDAPQLDPIRAAFVARFDWLEQAQFEAID